MDSRDIDCSIDWPKAFTRRFMMMIEYRIVAPPIARFTLNGNGAISSAPKREILMRVHYRSFTEQYLDSTGIFKEAVIGILAAVGKQERVRISERTIAELERARAQG